MIFQGILTSIAYKPYILMIFQGGGGPDPCPPPSGSAYEKHLYTTSESRYGPRCENACFVACEAERRRDEPAHQRCLVSVFAIRTLASLIVKLATCKYLFFTSLRSLDCWFKLRTYPISLAPDHTFLFPPFFEGTQILKTQYI